MTLGDIAVPLTQAGTPRSERHPSLPPAQDCWPWTRVDLGGFLAKIRAVHAAGWLRISRSVGVYP